MFTQISSHFWYHTLLCYKGYAMVVSTALYSIVVRFCPERGERTTVLTNNESNHHNHPKLQVANDMDAMHSTMM